MVGAEGAGTRGLGDIGRLERVVLGALVAFPSMLAIETPGKSFTSSHFKSFASTRTASPTLSAKAVEVIKLTAVKTNDKNFII
jgi:hypothetical protein